MANVSESVTPLGGDLNNTLLFAGKTVIARERATYPHPNHEVAAPAVMSTVDVVLLSDHSEVLQCRICGDTSWGTVRSAVVHASWHSRKRSSPDSTCESRHVDAGGRLELHTSRPRPAAVSQQTPSVDAAPDVLTALSEVTMQLAKLQLSVGECLKQLKRIEQIRDAAGDDNSRSVSAAELSVIREKARTYDLLRGMLP